MSPLRSGGKESHDAGTAIVEFTVLGLLLLIPLVYVMLTVLAVQRAALGVTAAAREAARVYATDPIAGQGGAAQAAAVLALRDQGLELDPAGLMVVCDPSCEPGGSVWAQVDTRVDIPLLPRVLIDGRSIASISVRGSHLERVDVYRSRQ